MAITHSEKYFSALKSNLPPGKIWQITWLLDLLKGCSNLFQRIDDYSIKIFVTEMVDNVETYKDLWGKILDIQNPNAAKIRGKLGATAGQNIADYQQLFDQISSNQIAIDFIPPARCGMSCGGYLAGIPWKYTIILSDINPDELETIKETVEKIEHAHINFLYFGEERWIQFG